MEEAIKQLIPVCIEAIKAGKSLGIWYLVAIQLVGFVKFILSWIFSLMIFKGAYTLVAGAINEK